VTASEGQAQSILEPVLSKMEAHENDPVDPVENDLNFMPEEGSMVAAESGENCDLEPGIDGNTDLAALLQESVGKGEDRAEEIQPEKSAFDKPEKPDKEEIPPPKMLPSETLRPEFRELIRAALKAKHQPDTEREPEETTYEPIFGLQQDGTYLVGIKIPEGFVEPSGRPRKSTA